MKSFITLSLILFLAIPSLQAETAPVDKPAISTTQAVKLTAEVIAVDMENRTVTLQGPEGNQRTIMAGEDAQRLDEVEVGDTVMVEYLQHLSIEVVAAEGAQPGHGTMVAVARAPETEQPGMIATETDIAMAKVHEINIEQNTFKLDWGENGIMEYVARDPENLKRAAVGDMVVVTYTEALALQLQEIPKE